MEKTGTMMVRSGSPRRFGTWLVFTVALAAAGCSGGDAPRPTLQSMTIGTGNGAAYAAVGVPRQLSLIGNYSDGTSVALTTGVAWASSDETVASVDPNGRVSPWRRGEGVVITATHLETGTTATTQLSCRDVVRVTGPATTSGSVDTAETYFRVSGLQPNVLYVSKISGMTDDVDLIVYGDMSMTAAAELCASDKVGRYDESCVARTNGAGELWIKADGQWTNTGANFSLSVAAAQPAQLAGTLAFPSAFPRPGSIGPVTELYKVTGLTPNATYDVQVSQLSADIDVQVYGDVYEYLLLCASYKSGTLDDACTARATSGGELFVLISGETTTGGGSYTLGVTMNPR